MSKGRRRPRLKKCNGITTDISYKGRTVDMDDEDATERLMEEIVGDAMGLHKKEGGADEPDKDRVV